MLWLFLTLISVLFVSIGNILQRVLMKGDKSNPYSYAVIFHFLLALFNFIFAIIFGVKLSLFSGNIFFLVLASVLWGACMIFVFKAFQLLEASEVTILSSIRVIITIVASIILLHETFNGQKVVGTMLIFIATVLVTNLKKGFKMNKGIVYVLLMSLLAGLAIVTDSFNVKQYDVLFYNGMQNFLSGIFILGLRPKALKQWEHFTTLNFLKKMVPLIFFSGVQGIAYLSALQTKGVTAQVGTIREATVIVTVFLAVIFLRERNHLLRKIIAAILVTLGVILLR